MGLVEYIPAIGGALIGMSIAKMYINEFVRRGNFKRLTQYFLTAQTEERDEWADKNIGDLDSLIRVYWDDDILGYKTKDGRPLNLTPSKSVPLNFHWGWGGGDTLEFGLRTHITEQGIKVGADAYFLSHMVSGHGNPMYALTFFNQNKEIN